MKPLLYSFLFLLLSNPTFAQVKELYVQQDKLWSAIVANKAEDVLALLKQGVKINELSYLGNYPFLEAAKRSKAEMITLLLANGADVNIESRYKQNALHISVLNRYAKLTQTYTFAVYFLFQRASVSEETEGLALRRLKGRNSPRIFLNSLLH